MEFELRVCMVPLCVMTLVKLDNWLEYACCCRTGDAYFMAILSAVTHLKTRYPDTWYLSDQSILRFAAKHVYWWKFEINCEFKMNCV